MGVGADHDREPLADPFAAGWETLACEREGAVAIVTLSRPERLNVMNVPMRDELRRCFEAIGADDSVRALVITGAGTAFSAGGDANDFLERSPEELAELMRELSHPWFSTFWALEIPTVAAVNGVAAGGGINLALACDLIVAAESARFGETFGRIGLMPDLGGLFTLPRTVGLHRAKALCLTGELIDARRAQEMGFVYEVVPDGAARDAAVALASRIAAGPPDAVRATKALLNRSFQLSMEELMAAELAEQARLFATEEHRARLAEFLNGSGDDGAGEGR